MSEPHDDATDYGALDRIDYHAIEQNGTFPPMSAGFVRTEAREGLEQIRDYVLTDGFVRLLTELYSHDPAERDAFVREVVLQPAEQRRRGVVPPTGVKLQRSQFGDDRPTIFCVTKLLSDGIRKVTYTFDNATPILTSV